uniref:Uncharacterized protein n=1 Tax=Arundo donax TaxID=35708 RepID=A0A0A9GNC1_ARUDO
MNADWTGGAHMLRSTATGGARTTARLLAPAVHPAELPPAAAPELHHPRGRPDAEAQHFLSSAPRSRSCTPGRVAQRRWSRRRASGWTTRPSPTRTKTLTCRMRAGGRRW